VLDSEALRDGREERKSRSQAWVWGRRMLDSEVLRSGKEQATSKIS
jgi:hypothetical protein